MNATKLRAETRYYRKRRAQGDHLHRIWGSQATSHTFADILHETGETAQDAFARMVKVEAQRLGVTPCAS